MVITADIFEAFLKCETKSHLKLLGAVGDQRAFSAWERKRTEDYRQQFCMQLRANCRDGELLRSVTLAQALAHHQCRFVLDCVVRTDQFQSHIPLLERITPVGKTTPTAYIPVRLFPQEKITPHDKLLLAFDALVLSTASGTAPPFGKIIYGREYAVAKVTLEELLKTARAVVEKITVLQGGHAPQLVLNKHCAECEFHAQCRQFAMEKDELSLLSGMTAKEIRKQQSRGIFSVLQLSYTFRARRRPKRFTAKPERYSHALRALAIREQKIHIAGQPALPIAAHPVYLDVEGVPDRDFYYLIGLRTQRGDAYEQYSFWANDKSEEKEIWAACLRTLTEIENPQLIHYGSYETIFLKRMKERYGQVVGIPAFLDRLIAEAVNLLAVIYARIYFPTYSNGLKDIARYLGFQWSDGDASGLRTLMWRSEWELSQDSHLKQKLLTYNAEDCEALGRLTGAIVPLCHRQEEATQRADNIIHTDSLKRESPYRFGKNSFVLPELEYINKAAYWDYQREKVYVRSSPRVKRTTREKRKRCPPAAAVNKIIECDDPRPARCPRCGATLIYKYGRERKIVYDLRRGRNGLKRWIVQYRFHCFICWQCKATFYAQDRPWTRSKYGPELVAYVMYLLIELRLPLRGVARHINQIFHLDLHHNGVSSLKAATSLRYQDTYQGILHTLVTGQLIHADETTVSIGGKGGYVWVFTSLEEVAYLYTETREGDFLQELLRDFHRVLVSDFYTVYDALHCPQQKCLIHLMRDLNEDLLKQPYNEELKELVREFAFLLKPMIETVDRFGLKAHFLRRHKVFVERFYQALSTRQYHTESAVHYKRRFEKNRDKLFTFLEYDGIPWNNNNAEHAIKAFAALRKNIDGMSTAKGIREYLILLSIYETCQYKGVNFLDFLRSGETDIDDFFGRRHKCQKGSLPGCRLGSKLD
jgi:predicted RecB family nuclease